MDIYLIRHSAVALKKGTCYGKSDVALKENCQLDFELVKKKLEGTIPELVYSSPANRCTQMAYSLTSKLQVKTDERLWELNFGKWELKAWKDLPQQQLRSWTENYIHDAPPSGESYSDLFSRTKAFWNEKIAGTQHENVFLITHGGVIRSILSYLLEIPLHKSFSLQIDLCSISKVVVKEEYSSIEFVNR